ncbi:MAG: hypothetical protein K2Q18_11905 [Bdellovibrionales bacterium]|nr:hypothetical protein [Bdellovibrionales bacterium]
MKLTKYAAPFFVTALMVLSSAPEAKAENLNYWRKGKTSISKDASLRGNKIKSKLGLRANSGTQDILKFDLKELNLRPRLNYSLMIRNTLLQSRDAIRILNQYTANPAVNPDSNMAEYIRQKTKRMESACLAPLLKNSKSAENFLISLDSTFKASEKEAAIKLSPEALVKKNQVMAKLNSIIQGGARNSKNLGISDILGQISDIDVQGGRITEIQFKKESNFSLSLNMMLTTLSGDEADYLKSESCISNYLKNLRDTLTYRIVELKKLGVEASQISLYRQKLAFLDNSLRPDNLTKEQHDILVAELNRNFPKEAQYVADYNIHIKNIAKVHGERELETITKRATLVHQLYTKLLKKSAFSLYTHNKLVTLSAGQIKFLTGVMLDLQGDNLPTEADMQEPLSRMTEAQAIEGEHYKLLHQQLLNFERTI